MVWPFSSNQPQQQQSSFNLGLPGGAQQTQQYGGGWNQQPQQQNPFMVGMGVPQQPIAPPSELELVAMLQQSATPIDSWLAGQGFQQMLSVVSSLVALNLVDFFRNATFVDDGEGLKLDVTSLPSQFQTMSAENISAELSTLQQAANAAIQAGIQRQQQILMMGQQSMMMNLMHNDGFMEQAGGAAGGLMRGVFNAATGMR